MPNILIYSHYLGGKYLSKKVRKNELERLIEKTISEVDKNIQPLTLYVNSIFATVGFRNAVDKKAFKKLKRKLQQYVGKNLKLSLSEDKRKIIIQIDYEIIL